MAIYRANPLYKKAKITMASRDQVVSFDIYQERTEGGGRISKVVVADSVHKTIMDDAVMKKNFKKYIIGDEIKSEPATKSKKEDKKK